MKTPAGKECPHYYQDFHRGRSLQQCRLAERNPESARWEPGDCQRCPVPDILHANASPHLRLCLTIRSGFLGFNRRNEVGATCSLHDIRIDDPIVGCPRCNAARSGIDEFLDALENSQ
jgi:hypothetical protein